VDWISFGSGVRILGGWQQTGPSLPTNATIRARGFCTGGQDNGSSWHVETVLGPVAISLQPANCTNVPGTTARFMALGAGVPPLTYQWCRGGAPLTDSGNVSGSQTGTLTLTNVLGADAGGYSVIITNSSGSVTSQVAMLTVIDPCITSQPVGQATNAGAAVVFSATAAGTEPLGYQWRRNGVSVAGATGLSLILTNVQWADAGAFDLLTSNCFGVVTSALATLTVNGPVILISDGNMGMHTNGFGFNVGCMPGQAVVIEASTNLLNWVPVQTNLVTGEGIFMFIDQATGSFPQRFYRARPYTGALPPPALGTDASSCSSNSFGFKLCGVPGQVVLIEASTNLEAWSSLTTNLLGAAPLLFTDPDAACFPARFYRAVLVP
jgi:hypothetical protein